MLDADDDDRTDLWRRITAAADAATDVDDALDALGELSWELMPQGTFADDAPASVPLLADLLPRASIGGHVAAVLGGFAHNGDPDDPLPAAVRAAVTAQVPRILPLLDDPDPWTRYAALYALAGCPDAAGAVGPVVLRHWRTEEDPRVRAGLVLTAAAFDRHTDLVDEALGPDQPPAVRAGAVLAIVHCRRKWPGARAVDAVRAAWRDGDPFVGDGTGRWRPNWYPGALETLLERLKPADRPPILLALLQSPYADIQLRAATQASWMIGEWRSARARFVPALVGPLSSPDLSVRSAAADAIRRSGPAAAAAAHELWLLAARHDDPHHDRHPDRPAAQALATLVELGDPRADAFVAIRIETGTAADDLGAALAAAGAPASAELLAAVRVRLRALVEDPPRPHEPDALRSMPGRSRFVDPERTTLLMLVASWGPAGAPAVPELVALLRAGRAVDGVLEALAAIGPAAVIAGPTVVADLDDYAAAIRGDRERGAQRVAAARTRWILTGDPEPAIDVAWRNITSGRAGGDPVGLLAEIGAPARRLLTAIRRAEESWLTDVDRYASERIGVARLAYAWTGDSAAALAIARTFLDGPPGGHARIEAALLAAEVAADGAADDAADGAANPAGIAADPAADLDDRSIAGMLTDIVTADRGSFDQGARACRALWRLTGDPGPALVALVERMASAPYPPTTASWAGVHRLLEELGTDAAPARPALARLARRDRSVVGAQAGEQPGHVDERVRELLRNLSRGDVKTAPVTPTEG